MSEKYQPSPEEVRKAEENLDDISYENNPIMPSDKTRLRELTEVREDSLYEGKKQFAETKYEGNYPREIKQAIDLERFSQSPVKSIEKIPTKRKVWDRSGGHPRFSFVDAFSEHKSKVTLENGKSIELGTGLVKQLREGDEITIYESADGSSIGVKLGREVLNPWSGEVIGE